MGLATISDLKKSSSISASLSLGRQVNKFLFEKDGRTGQTDTSDENENENSDSESNKVSVVVYLYIYICIYILYLYIVFIYCILFCSFIVVNCI